MLSEILICQGGLLLPSLEVNIKGRDGASKYRVGTFTYVSVLQLLNDRKRCNLKEEIAN